MAVRPILISGEPVLHSAAESVIDFDADLRALVDDMVETMEQAPGVGLAAPQVGVPLRVFVYHWTDDADQLHSGVAVNPQLWMTPIGLGEADPETESEGCLSFPGERFPLKRASSVILRAVDLEQRPFELQADGWLARIFQHEYDHLDGILYTDRLDDAFRRPVAKVIRKAGWGGPGASWLPGRDDLDA